VNLAQYQPTIAAKILDYSIKQQNSNNGSTAKRLRIQDGSYCRTEVLKISTSKFSFSSLFSLHIFHRKLLVPRDLSGKALSFYGILFRAIETPSRLFKVSQHTSASSLRLYHSRDQGDKMSSPSPSKSPAPPGTLNKHVQWLLPSTVQPHDIDGLANFAQAITQPSSSGCWGRARCECPLKPTDTFEESQERIFNCLWRQLAADMDAGIDEDSSFCSADEAYNSQEIYDSDFSEIESGGDEYDEAREDEYEEEYEAGQEQEEILSGQADVEARRDDKAFTPKARSNGKSGPYRWELENDNNLDEEEAKSTTSPEKGAAESEASIDDDQLKNIADGMFRGNMARAIKYVEKEKRKANNKTSSSQPNSNTTKNFGAVGAHSSVGQSNDFNTSASTSLPSMRTLSSLHDTSSDSNLSSMHRTSDATDKRKRAPDFGHDLDDEDDYNPPSKNKDKSGDFARSSTETISKTNSGLGTQVPRKKPRQAPAESHDAVQKIPQSTWPTSQADTLHRLLQAHRASEKANNVNPSYDMRLWDPLAIQLNRAINRAPGEKPRTGNACKNFWNRYGREHYNFDERSDTKRSDSKVTSTQSSKKVLKAKQQTKTKRKVKQEHDANDEEEFAESEGEGGNWKVEEA